MNRNKTHRVMRAKNAKVPVYIWNKDVNIDINAIRQIDVLASMPFISPHIAIMPDAHWGKGATIGSVIPTDGTIMPAAVGVDLGCGVLAAPVLGATADDLPDEHGLAEIRQAIEQAIPTGFNRHKLPHEYNSKEYNEAIDRLDNELNYHDLADWKEFVEWIETDHPNAWARRKKPLDLTIMTQFGTLGGGNHFIELCLDESDNLWVLIHSGSRGMGATLSDYFIRLAKADMERRDIDLPNEDLAYIEPKTQLYTDYARVLDYAQHYAEENRFVMSQAVMDIVRSHINPAARSEDIIDCPHNFASWEIHQGYSLLITRKGACGVRRDQLAVIPGSMGTRSFIVAGRGNEASFMSCSHGAGRNMSRRRARRAISLEDHAAATAGVECRKDGGVLDESPAAYKDIEKVIAAQEELISVKHSLKQVICVKG